MTTMKAAKSGLEAFDPAERARAGQEMVRANLADNARRLLSHLDNEHDDRVVAAIAHAIAASERPRREPKRVAKLRAWADQELQRLELQDRFQGVVEFAPAPPQPQPARPAQPEPKPRPASPTYISWHPPG